MVATKVRELPRDRQPSALRGGQPQRVETEGYDFDLHGMIGIRLLDASPSDRAVVSAQVGPIAGLLERAPDIVIRFVDRIETRGPLHLVGVGEAAHDQDTFLLLRSRQKSPARVRIALDQIGQCCEIECERGLRAVPLLLAIINLTILAKGGLAVHASAFRHQGRGVLVTGWSKSGKSETLLAFLEHGAEYVGDEWIYLSPDARTMFGIPEPLRVWDWQLAQLPHYRSQLRRAERWRLRALGAASGSVDALSMLTRSGTRQQLHRLRALIERQRYGFLRPETAFAAGNTAGETSIDRLIFLTNVEEGPESVQAVDAGWVADRMVHSMEEERLPLLSAYRQFRFAFPARRNPLIEAAARLERRRLRRLLAGVSCHAVAHPYPPSIRGLYDTIAPLLST